ncbi:MAG TPA: deoxyribodipyrimidine photo-lyase [Chthoniobacteraceae bacterium]|jgi:deoxyribodipyrimidine photo-lyase
MSIAIHWFRRDLRLTDNTSLLAATAQHEQLVPVYMVSDWRGEHRWTGAPRQEFLCGSLAELSRNLAAKGGRLIIRRGRADEVLRSLLRETRAEAIHCNRDPDPFGRQMEARVEAMAARVGVAFHTHQDLALHERDELLTSIGSPFKVFTPYARAWLAREKTSPGRALGPLSTPAQIRSDPLPSLATWDLFPAAKIVEPGEAAARQRLGVFLDGPILHYGAKRDLPAEDGTSRLSQDLRWGTLSIREIYARVVELAANTPLARRRSIELWMNELIWREFYFQVLWNAPHVLEHEFQPGYRGMKWQNSDESLARWCSGQTGFPIVDAGMRQLAASGFMQNRVRMITAMFLTKDLHLDWRLGESWFMRQLVDGEIASNNGGWQWSASTGTDAAPYFRIQNPWSQTKRFDPEGAYIKRWVPELGEVAPRRFQEPPPAGESLAKGYPPPMIDHARERQVALEMYRR